MIAVRYATRAGNTEKLANALAEAIGAKAENVSVPLVEKVDILFLGNSLYAGKPDPSVVEFIKNEAKNIGVIVNFGSSASLRSTYKKIKEVADEYGIKMYEKEFICPGSFLFMHKGRPGDQDLSGIAEFAKSALSELSC